MKNTSSKVRVFIGTLIAVLAPAAIVYANLNTLNGQSGATQTFSNDSNVTISSASNVHTLGWSGALATSRGGTGTTTWINGSIPFFNGTRLTEDSGIKYDFANWPPATSQKILILGTGQDQAVIQGAWGTSNNPDGGNLTITAGWAFSQGSDGNGGGINIYGGDAGTNGNSGDIRIGPGGGGYVSGNGGALILYAGEARGNGNSGNIELSTSLDTFLKTREEPIEDPVAAIRRIAEARKFSQKLTDEVISSYLIEPEPNRFGMINAFTNAAQRLAPLQRIEMERFAGTVAGSSSTIVLLFFNLGKPMSLPFFFGKRVKLGLFHYTGN